MTDRNAHALPTDAFLTSIVFESRGKRIELSPDRVRALEAADLGLVSTFEIEEAFDALVSNYLQLEEARLALTIRHGVRRMQSQAAADDSRRLLSLCLSNLLSTARAYMDLATRVLGAGEMAPVGATFREERSKHFDASPSYRLMEQLRNHAQHHAAPVSSLVIQSQWEGGETPRSKEGAARVQSIQFKASAAELCSTFKMQHRSVISELADKDGTVDLIGPVREYVGGLGATMKTIRQSLAPLEEKWKRVVGEAGRDLDMIECSPLGRVIAIEKGGGPFVLFYLPDHMVERIELLRDRNGDLAGIRYLAIKG